MKTLTSTLAIMTAVVTTLNVNAAEEVSLAGKTFTVDTVSHYTTAPGVTYSLLKFTGSGQWFNAHAVTFDLDNLDNVELKVEPGSGICNTTERVTTLLNRKKTDTNRPLAAINADFFITESFVKNHVLGNKILGYPNTVSVTDGKIISPDAIDAASHINSLIMTKNGKMWIDQTDLTYDFIGPNKTSRVKIYHANYPLQTKEIVLYNSYSGPSTKTDAGCCEIALELAEGETWGVNRDIIMKVVSEPSDKGNMTIPVNGAVISADAGRTAQINYIKNNLTLGAEVKVRVMISLPGYDNIQPEEITEVVGGDVRILHEGVTTSISAPDRFINSCNSPYSRSMIGYSQDYKKLVICVTDRGAKQSLFETVGYGTSYPQGGDLMKYLGCSEALNFDGGGSTLMWTADKSIVNVPRDGSERSVGNVFAAYLKTPADNKIASIAFADRSKILSRGEKYSPVVLGYNKNGELINNNITGFTLSCPSSLGTTNGASFTASGSGYNVLSADYNGMTATVAVGIEGTFNSVDDVVVDNNSPVEYYDLRGVKVDNPDSGMYITRQGSVTDKVILK